MIITDIQVGHEVKNSQDNGYEVTDIILVTGSDVDVGSQGASQCYEAIELEDIPQRGDSHSVVTVALLREITARPLDNNCIELTLHYIEKYNRSPQLNIFSYNIGAATVQGDTIFDHAGDIFYVTHLGINKTAPASKLIPQMTLTAKKRISSTKNTIRDKAVAYVGKVNSSTFEGAAARYWLCTNISGVSDDGGSHWDMTYEFQYNPNTWDAYVAWKDPKEDSPPMDLVQNAGWKKVQIYQTANFDNIY